MNTRYSATSTAVGKRTGRALRILFEKLAAAPWRAFLLPMKNILLIICLAAGLLAQALAAPPYPIGERLVFNAEFIGFIPIGTVWMDITTGVYNNAPTVQFNGRCLGDFKFYVADVRVTSHIAVQSDQAVYHYIEQFGSERRGRRLLFDWPNNQMQYVRLERDGQYRLRRSVPVTPDVFDVFSAAFWARRMVDPVVGTNIEIKVIETERVFHLRCTIVERRPFVVKGIGTFDAVRLKFEALNLQPNEIFKGFLDLDKDIVVWLEATTRTPLYMSSKVPFGIFRPTVEVFLKEWHTVPGFEPRLSGTNAYYRN
jgi:hypothetical protein